ncbi:Transposase or inactivated derivative (plasmid) [Leuconostoc citreum KM20]|uniref:Transposase or inactivated derivative n=1 Tax=Leuconostoc citreum (strain KM20) TaxID=349519 RepID=B1N0L0_LEUCK|nr:Transposase or inactivated derivative [Leuconostoc citreum KM20]
MNKGQSKTLKDVKQLEKRLAILEEENEILSRLA